MRLKIAPIGLRAANEFITAHHRHHKAMRGCKFCVAVENENGECCGTSVVCGVAICGRPVSRYLDNGRTLKINRLCTIGVKNACSMLYGACIKAAKALGYERVIYTLESENGASLKASNFTCEDGSRLQGLAGGAAGRCIVRAQAPHGRGA